MKPIKVKRIKTMPMPQPANEKKTISEKRKQERIKALEELQGLWADKDESFFDLGHK
jgi:hypothetical protein